MSIVYMAVWSVLYPWPIFTSQICCFMALSFDNVLECYYSFVVWFQMPYASTESCFLAFYLILTFNEKIYYAVQNK